MTCRPRTSEIFLRYSLRQPTNGSINHTAMTTLTRIREDLLLVQHRLWTGPPGGGFAHGATLGQEHRRPLIDFLERELGRQDGQAALVILDFYGIESASASYIKATLVALSQAGEAAMRGESPDPASDALPALQVYPMVAGLAPDVADELDLVLRDCRGACLEALACTTSGVTRAAVHPAIEEGLLWTLDLVARERIVTATHLYEQFPYDRQGPPRAVTVTAWNNRLAELHRLRLAHRTRQGRQWFYHSLVGEVVHG